MAAGDTLHITHYTLHITHYTPPVVVVVAPAPVHPLPHHVGDELAAPGKLAAQLRVATIAQNPE